MRHRNCGLQLALTDLLTLFPQSEMERMDIMHGMIYKALGNKLYLAPLEEEKLHRALDLGTGTGICKPQIFIVSSPRSFVPLHHWHLRLILGRGHGFLRSVRQRRGSTWSC